MVRFQTCKNIGYTCGLLASSALAYSAAFCTTSNLSLEGCDPSKIAFLTLATKEAVYLVLNSVLHPIFCSFSYENFPELKEDMKKVTVSNLSAVGFCTLAKGLLHYGGMKWGIDSSTSMLASYLLIGPSGSTLKIILDFKNGLFGKKKAKNLEEKL
jgi:hypothetical protein